MEDFKTFEKINRFCEEKENKCSHEETEEENGFRICTECFEQIGKVMNNNSCFSDISRTQIRNSYEKNIYNDVKHMNFSLKIVDEANDLYNSVTQGKILRGDSRKSVIFACIYFTYKKTENFQIPDELILIFGLSRKKSLRGLKYVICNKKIIFTNSENDESIQIKEYINRMILIFSGTDSQKKEIFELWRRIKNRSSILNRSRPECIVSSIIYYSMRNKINLIDFSKKVRLSESTIKKNMIEILKILG